MFVSSNAMLERKNEMLFPKLAWDLLSRGKPCHQCPKHRLRMNDSLWSLEATANPQ